MYRIIVIFTCVLFLYLTPLSHAEPFSFSDSSEQKRLTILEKDKPVLTFNYGDQLAKGVHKKYARSCYIHPLYSLNGKILTSDFPTDHPHHRGVFWAWPNMKARGKQVQTWAPDILKQRFVQWTERKADENGATLAMKNEWIMDGEVIGQENVKIHVHPATNIGRAVDITLTVEAVGGPVELFGPRYGGMNIRLTKKNKSGTWTADSDPIKGDQHQKSFSWVDYSSKKTNGIALFVSPNHPNFPPKWLLRSSYGSVMCVHWPTEKPYTLRPGKPLTFSYRIYIHQKDAKAGLVSEAYQEYSKECSNSSEHPVHSK